MTPIERAQYVLNVYAAGDSESVIGALATDFLRLSEENKMLREALEFYAEEEHYKDRDNSCSDPECCGGPNPSFVVIDDSGEKARAALAKAGDKNEAQEE